MAGRGKTGKVAPVADPFVPWACLVPRSYKKLLEAYLRAVHADAEFVGLAIKDYKSSVLFTVGPVGAAELGRAPAVQRLEQQSLAELMEHLDKRTGALLFVYTTCGPLSPLDVLFCVRKVAEAYGADWASDVVAMSELSEELGACTAYR